MNKSKFEYHRFLDEAGDTTFYGKKRSRIVGNNGVSKCFVLGMLKINEPIDGVRQKVIHLQNEIASDPYFHGVPSIEKKKNHKGYFLHAKDDLPEVRMKAYKFIQSINCSFEAVVARKIYDIYERNHDGKQEQFYADILSHLLKNKFNRYPKLVLTIAERGQSTSNINLEKGLQMALERKRKTNTYDNLDYIYSFNVQNPTTEPLLNIADYFCWCIQRVFERGDIRFYKYMVDQIPVVVDLYDSSKYDRGQNYYRSGKNELTAENQI